jgi:hypothetical protein
METFANGIFPACRRVCQEMSADCGNESRECAMLCAALAGGVAFAQGCGGLRSGFDPRQPRDTVVYNGAVYSRPIGIGLS